MMKKDSKSKKIFNVPHLRFKEFNGEWEKYRCSDFLTSFPTNSLSWEMLSYGENTQIYNLHYGLIHNGAPTLIDTKKYRLPCIKSSSIKNQTQIYNGDVIFADASEDTTEIGKCIEFINTNNQIIYSGLHTIHTRDIKDLTILGFKAFLFQSNYFHKQVERITQGTKIYSLHFTNFKELYVNIPNKKEQQKIATFLTLIDKRIETQMKIIEEMKSLMNSIVIRIFGDKSRFLTKWKKTKLSEVLTERKLYAQKDSEFAHVTLSKDGIIDKTDRYNRDFLVKDEEKEYKITKLNDICYNPANLKFGVICLNKYGDAIFSPIYVTFEINKNYNPHFIELALTNATFIRHIRKYEQGTVYERMAVNSEDFLKGIILAPSLEEQNDIVKIFSVIDNKLKIEMKILKKIKQQKTYLLNNMFI